MIIQADQKQIYYKYIKHQSYAVTFHSIAQTWSAIRWRMLAGETEHTLELILMQRKHCERSESHYLLRICIIAVYNNRLMRRCFLAVSQWDAGRAVKYSFSYLDSYMTVYHRAQWLDARFRWTFPFCLLSHTLLNTRACTWYESGCECHFN